MKCEISGCETEFSVVYETHHPIELQPVIICRKHWEEMNFSTHEIEKELRYHGNRCK